MSQIQHDKYDDIQAAVIAGRDSLDIGARTGEIEVRGDEGAPQVIPVAIDARGEVKPLRAVLELADEVADAPRRRRGTARHQELDSFVAHVNRFKSADSAIWADVEATKLLAVLDYHPPEGAAWGQHRAVYDCPFSEAWKIWTAAEGEAMGQVAFGEFLEEREDDLVDPEKGESGAGPIEMVELAQHLEVYTKGTFNRKIDRATGEHSLISKEEHDTKSTKIPKRFFLGLPVFEGGAAYRVEARLRFSMTSGAPMFAYRLHRRAEILRDAFIEVRHLVEDGCKLPVFAGTPE